ncbi:MAG: 30S ribosomal protein S5 [Candidatus Andersenbacteria bacterium]
MDRRPRGRKPKSEFDHKMVDLARVARVVAGGKRFKFRAAVVLGDRKGRVGFGMAKGRDVSNSVEKASRIARKNLVEIPIVNDTIPHQVRVHFGGADVLLKPARPGTGIIAGGAVRPVIELSGIKNIISKTFGSSNAANNAKATIEALGQLRTPEMLSETRGVAVRGTFQREQAHSERAKKDVEQGVGKKS